VNTIFSGKFQAIGRISKTVRDRAKVTVNHGKEIAYAFSDEIKIIDPDLR